MTQPHPVRVAAGLLGCVVPGAALIGKLVMPPCTPQLEQLLLSRTFVTRVPCAASADGIDLTLDGRWNQKGNSRAVKNEELGMAVDEPAVVNQVTLKERSLETTEPVGFVRVASMPQK